MSNKHHETKKGLFEIYKRAFNMTEEEFDVYMDNLEEACLAEDEKMKQMEKTDSPYKS